MKKSEIFEMVRYFFQSMLFIFLMLFFAFSIASCSPKATKYSVNACPNWSVAKR